MAHTHEYDCIVCGAHFDDSRSLDKHNREEHLKTAQGNEVPRDKSADRNARPPRDDEITES